MSEDKIGQCLRGRVRTSRVVSVAVIVWAALAPMNHHSALCWAQSASAAAPPRFEVASVEPEPPAEPGGTYGCFGGPGTADPIRYRCSRATVAAMAFQAYGLKTYQFPDYYSYTTEYSVDAKVPPGATPEQVKLMLRNLLADRFKLVAHFEKKEMPIYRLTVAEGGLKIKESAPVDAGATRPQFVPDSKLEKGPDGLPILAPQPNQMRVLRANGLIRLVAGAMPLASLVNYLSNQLDRPVLDATGLTAKYDFILTFTSDSVKEGSRRAPSPDEAVPPAAGGQTIFAAIERGLGLKLEKTKGMIDVFLIDNVEKTPSPN